MPMADLPVPSRISADDAKIALAPRGKDQVHAKIKADISNNAVLRYLRGIIYGAFGKTTYCYFEDVNRPGYIV